MKWVLALFFPCVITVLGAVAFSALTKAPLWASFVIVALAVFANSLLLSIEDKLPGGYNNPGPASTPAHARHVGAGVRIFCVFAALLCIIIFVAWARS